MVPHIVPAHITHMGFSLTFQVHSRATCFAGKNNWRGFRGSALRLPVQKILFPLNKSLIGGGRRQCYSSATAVVLAVAESSSISPADGNIIPALQQRSAEWFQLRKGRLTASSFSSALGFWKDGRVELWEQKVGLAENFTGNSATEWGVTNESKALQRYQEITGNIVTYFGFQIYKEEDDAQGWLGASPDGIIDTDVFGLSDKGGILEVKCPHNKGRPEYGSPWISVPYYYMPQIQGLLEILDRDWLDFYVWTLNGSVIFRVDRDPEYWILIFRVLSEFWWTNVVPAKQALLIGQNANPSVFKPTAQHELTPHIISQSRELAIRAKMIFKSIAIMENSE